MTSSGNSASCAPASRARARYSRTFASLPAMSPTVGLIWARATRICATSYLGGASGPAPGDRLRPPAAETGSRPAGLRRALARRRARLGHAGGARQLRDRAAQVVGQRLEVWQCVVVAEQAERQPPVIAHDRDPQRLVVRQRHDRI